MTQSLAINWAHLLAQAAQPLPLGRLPLHLNDALIGSVSASDAVILAGCHPALRCTAQAVHVSGDFTEASAALAAMALALKHAGQLKGWRDELLPVGALPTAGAALTFDAPLACVERAAARRLGVLTHAVHLLGFASDANPQAARSAPMWLQERASNKATDPGMWDTLAGGLVAAGDSLHSGLLRETYEEAGLAAEQLLGLQAHGGLLVQRQVPEGVMLELAWTYAAVLAPGALPHNLDGEVAGFACLSADAVRGKIAAEQVTLEAALAIGIVWGDVLASAALPHA